MSNLLLPNLRQPPNLSWAWPVKKTPSFSTIVQTPASRRGEVRISLTPNPVWNFEVDLSYVKGDLQSPSSLIAELISFYNLMQGAATDWLFQDPYDNGILALPLINGNFEQSSSLPPPGWTQAAGTLSYDTTAPYDGVRSLVVSGTPGTAQSASVPCSPGQTISVSCYAKVINNNLSVGLVFLNASGSIISTVTDPGFHIVLGWLKITVDATAPAGTVAVAVQLSSVGTSASAEFDDVTLSQMLLGPQLLGYGDGVTTQFQIGRIIGSPGGFETMQNVFPTMLYVGGTQVPPGPQASNAFNEWNCGLENYLFQSQSIGNSPWLLGANMTLNNSTTTAPDGTSTASSLTGSGAQSYVLQNVLDQALLGGHQVTFSVWLRSSTGTINTHIGTGIIVSGGGTPGFTFVPVTLDTAWQRFSVTITTPASVFGITGIQVQIGEGADLNGLTAYAWGAQLERWPSPTSYIVTTTTAPVRPKGLVTFNTAPAAGSAITADFSYYYRCRFLDDEWNDLQEFLYQIWELKSMKFRSLIL